MINLSTIGIRATNKRLQSARNQDQNFNGYFASSSIVNSLQHIKHPQNQTNYQQNQYGSFNENFIQRDSKVPRGVRSGKQVQSTRKLSLSLIKDDYKSKISKYQHNKNTNQQLRKSQIQSNLRTDNEIINLYDDFKVKSKYEVQTLQPNIYKDDFNKLQQNNLQDNKKQNFQAKQIQKNQPEKIQIKRRVTQQYKPSSVTSIKLDQSNSYIHSQFNYKVKNEKIFNLGPPKNYFYDLNHQNRKSVQIIKNKKTKMPEENLIQKDGQKIREIPIEEKIDQEIQNEKRNILRSFTNQENSSPNIQKNGTHNKSKQAKPKKSILKKQKTRNKSYKRVRFNETLNQKQSFNKYLKFEAKTTKRYLYPEFHSHLFDDDQFI